MGCFPACFYCSASSKSRKSVPSKENQGVLTPKLIQSDGEEAKREEDLLIKLVREAKEEVENQVKCGCKKRVTFNLNKETERVGFDLLENNEDERQKSAKEEASKEMEPLSDANPLIKVLGAKSNYKFRDFDKEEENCGDIDVASDDYESSESLFSLSLDSRKRAFDSEIGENEVNSGPLEICALSKENAVTTIEPGEDSVKRPRLDDESVLKPIENLSRLVDEVERPMVRHLKHEDKENVISLEPRLKENGPKPKLFDETKLERKEIRVDTSFSSWLIESENSPSGLKSDKLLGDSMIGEVEQNLTRPVISTVESYWVHTGQELDSDLNSSLLRNANSIRGNREMCCEKPKFSS